MRLLRYLQISSLGPDSYSHRIEPGPLATKTKVVMAKSEASRLVMADSPRRTNLLLHSKVVKIPQTTGYSADFRPVLLCGNAMSALGQKQTLADVRVMSALPPKADIAVCDRQVCITLSGDRDWRLMAIHRAWAD